MEMEKLFFWVDQGIGKAMTLGAEVVGGCFFRMEVMKS